MIMNIMKVLYLFTKRVDWCQGDTGSILIFTVPGHLPEILYIAISSLYNCPISFC